MCNCRENCLKWTPIGPKQGKLWKKLISEAEFGSRNILNTNLINLAVDFEVTCQLKQGKQNLKKSKTKFLSNVSMPTAERVP